MMQSGTSTVDAAEIARFDALAARWWASDGPMRPLHALNPVRVRYVRDQASDHFGHATPPRTAAGGRVGSSGGGSQASAAAGALAGLSVLDVGCGGGILSEPMARLGGQVTGLDPASANIAVARHHAEAAGLDIDYRAETVEAVVATGAQFDIVLAMEVVEHVADVGAFLQACTQAVRPGGLLVMSTLNRTLRAWAVAIVGAEYVLGWLPRGTHEWSRFVTPEELRKGLNATGLEVVDTTGMVPDPLGGGWRLSHDTAVNYLMTAVRAP